jgi:hypothetical protein
MVCTWCYDFVSGFWVGVCFFGVFLYGFGG